MTPYDMFPSRLGLFPDPADTLFADDGRFHPPGVPGRMSVPPIHLIVVERPAAWAGPAEGPWSVREPPFAPGYEARAIAGEVLRDASGRLFERLGRSIRPLQRLAQGPGGQLLELISTERSTEAAVDADQLSPTWRALLPEPGERRIVRLADFDELMRAQLSHPERVRGTHRLACHVQVYESAITQSLDRFAGDALGSADRARELCRLGPREAEKLGISGWLPRAQERPLHDDPGLLQAGERCFRLTIDEDPTSAPEPAEPLPARTEIPERFIRPLDLRLTREEALHQCAAAALHVPAGPLVRRILGAVRHRAAVRRWRAQLEGRDREAQLWEIRPPVGALTNPAIREWARTTLALAGYDPGRMLLEWEVFWRRHGA